MLWADGAAGRGPLAPREPAIPELAWQERSDWINVKTAVTPPAKGGAADDTAAIQAALERIQDAATIYFPPGTYRITQTLVVPHGRFLGVSLVGHGRTTVLAWHGPPGGRMFWTQDGIPYSRYVGLTWDGRGQAAVGFDHACLKIFETEIRHQHEAFVNFTEADVRAWPRKKSPPPKRISRTACSSMRTRSLAAQLQRSGPDVRGLRVPPLRRRRLQRQRHELLRAANSHFEHGADTDIVSAGEQGSSVRRCTSHGSKQFLRMSSSVGPLVIQDCRVDAWTHAGGAVQLGEIRSCCSIADSSIRPRPKRRCR